MSQGGSVGIDLLAAGSLTYALVGALLGAGLGFVAGSITTWPFNLPGSGAALALVGALVAFYIGTQGLPTLGQFPPSPDRIQDAICVLGAALLALMVLIRIANAMFGDRITVSVALFGGLVVFNLLVLAISLYQRPLGVPPGIGGTTIAGNPGPMGRPVTPIDSDMRARANTLFIVVGGLRWDRVPMFNPAAPPMPGLGSLERDSITFYQAIATSSDTGPAMTSLVTGSLVANHRVQFTGLGLGPEVRTLFQIQQESGIHTAAVLDHPDLGDLARGFDYVAPLPMVDGPGAPPQLTELRLFDRLRRIFGELRQDPGSSVGGPPPPVPSGGGTGSYGRSHQESLDIALRFIEDKRAARWSVLVHLPAPLMADGNVLLQDRDLIRTEEARYREHLQEADQAIFEFLQRLRNSGLYENTMIVLTADHGVHLGERGTLGIGGTLYDESIRVPLFIKVPGQYWSRYRYHAQVMAYDAFVTAVRRQRLFVPQQMDTSAGDIVELVSKRLGGQQSEECRLRALARRTAVSEVVSQNTILRSVRSRGYKLITSRQTNSDVVETVSLFDVIADPGELQDISSSRRRNCAGIPERNYVERLGGDLKKAQKAVKGASDQAVSSEPATPSRSVDEHGKYKPDGAIDEHGNRRNTPRSQPRDRRGRDPRRQPDPRRQGAQFPTRGGN